MREGSGQVNYWERFHRSVYPAFTVGLPFCVFKLFFGMMAIRVGDENMLPSLAWLGWLACVWAVVDAAMNLSRAACHFLTRRREPPMEFCLLAQVGAVFGWPRTMLAIDTFLSFAIICFFLWSRWIVRLNCLEANIWYAATTVNLLGLALVNIIAESVKDGTSGAEK